MEIKSVLGIKSLIPEVTTISKVQPNAPTATQEPQKCGVRKRKISSSKSSRKIKLYEEQTSSQRRGFDITSFIQPTNEGIDIEDYLNYRNSRAKETEIITNSGYYPINKVFKDDILGVSHSKDPQTHFSYDFTISPLRLASTWEQLRNNGREDHGDSSDESVMCADIDPTLCSNRAIRYREEKDNVVLPRIDNEYQSHIAVLRQSTLKVIQSPCENFQPAKTTKFISMDNQIIYRPTVASNGSRCQL